MAAAVMIATWPFGLRAVRRRGTCYPAAGGTRRGGRGATSCEDDESVDSVGYGGLPDASGEVTLDASVMDHRGGAAPSRAFGGSATQRSCARAVMDKTPTSCSPARRRRPSRMAEGFREEDLLSPRAGEAYARWRAERAGAGQRTPDRRRRQ
jgi:isoaspartyl peptidase/L-asparaginase-like protein (Ntn-hydrolase superfamily)